MSSPGDEAPPTPPTTETQETGKARQAQEQSPAAPPALERFVQGYLATLEATSPSTQRQRTWALRELSAHPGASSPAAMLSGAHVRSWLDAAATDEPPASLPGLRARASAARALAQHGERTAVLAAGTAEALGPVLRMPAPPLSPGPDPDPVRRLLVAAHPDARPLAVHPAVWTRFCAHVHLLALTGEREDVMAQLLLADVTGAPSNTPTTSGDDDPRTASPSETDLTRHDLTHGDLTRHDLTSQKLTGLPLLRGSDESHIDGEAVTPPLFSADPASDWEQLKRTVRERQPGGPSGAPPRPPSGTGSGAAPGAGPGAAARGWVGGGAEAAGGLPGRPGVATHVRIERGLSPRSWRLGEPARTAISGWLADRAVLASLLRGSEPVALWLRVRPSTDLRTGALRPAGLPVSDRGLRLAFTTTLAVLAQEDQELRDLSTAAVRAFARGRGPA